MIYIQPQNAASKKVAVTGTATRVFALMDTAGTLNNSQSYYALKGANALLIQPEDGNVRIEIGVNPTATTGTLLTQGGTYCITGLDLSDLRFIRTGASNVAVTVQPIKAEPGEANAFAGAGGSSTVQGQYNASPITLVDGATGTLQLTINGYLANAEQYAAKAEDNINNVFWITPRPGVTSWTTDKSVGAVTKRNVKASAGYVGGIYVSNRNAALRYFQIHAKATAPTGGDVALYSFEIPINGALVLDATHFGLGGDPVATGVSWAISTTNTTFTDSATASEHNVYFRWA